MISFAINNRWSSLQAGTMIVGVGAFTLFAIMFGLTLNQSLALLLTATIITMWQYNKVNALIASVMFFLIKPFIVRSAYWYDFNLTGSGGFDLLGITPALAMALLIVIHLYPRIVSDQYKLLSRTEILLAIFCAISFFSIFNPVNSLIVGLGGFERNILPNMMIMFLCVAIFKNNKDIIKLMKAMMVLGIISCLYAIGQYSLGVYPWEIDWLMNVAFRDSFDGWYTIGLRGIELRIFSIFYNYMDFTFVNALILAMVLALRSSMSRGWRKAGIFYMIIWFTVLVATIERMPMLMSLAAVYVMFILKSSPKKRKRILAFSSISISVIVISLNLAGGLLRNTGAQTFIRLAEMSNPLSAGSISDRVERKWQPTLQIISSYPLGVGIGFGSQTKASRQASKAGFLIEPHNELLQKTLETGVVGGLVYLMLLISTFRDNLKLSKLKRLKQKFGHGMIAATIGFWLCGLVNLPFSGSPGLLYWMLAGVSLALIQNADEVKDSSGIDRDPVSVPEKRCQLQTN